MDPPLTTSPPKELQTTHVTNRDPQNEIIAASLPGLRADTSRRHKAIN